jgi:hypothetical protein
VRVTTDQPVTLTFSNGVTRTFEPDVLARTGASTPELVPLLLALAVGLRLVVGRSGGGGRAPVGRRGGHVRRRRVPAAP